MHYQGALSVSLAVFLGSTSLASDDELSKRLLSAESGHETGTAVSRLLAAAGKQKLTDLKRDRNPTMALFAAWEEGRSTEPLEARFPGAVGNPLANTSRALREAHVARFIGSVEGRLGATPPDFWEKQLLRCLVFSNGRERYFVGLNGGDAGNRLGLQPVREIDIDGSLFLKAADDISISKGDGSFAIRRDGKTARVAEEILREEVFGEVIVGYGENEAYVGFPSGHASGYTLIRIDEGAMKPRWKQDVWALDVETAAPGGTTGSWYHSAALVIGREEIFVFGAELMGMYIEGFNKDTGKPTVRFATNYWFQPRPFADELK